MGQKVNPIGLRLSLTRGWKSIWYADPRTYADIVHEDLKLRRLLYANPLARGADIADVTISRDPQRITIFIHTARPGVIIGSKGATIEKITNSLQKEIKKQVQIKILEIERPEANAQITAMSVARQLRTRSVFRRTLKMAVANAMKSGAQGIKIKIAGRLGGGDMSRVATYREGRVPLHTLRAVIDYGFEEARTTFGTIGVKVWIFHSDAYKRKMKEDAGLVAKKRRPHEGRNTR